MLEWTYITNRINQMTYLLETYNDNHQCMLNIK